ncbi:hypothetical protein [Belliella pelovolcani]|uniref:Uncharacterized protein n=1 Tax=Belliella pelovolcani TaxID=529505 RepID=A0A1N7Q1U1_9BACT|nr:hypothetical protein [Belliella pelovolcani]SIT16806.1 hypothetical protein SAMN05421761_1259 [Belliella pelovolcani]
MLDIDLLTLTIAVLAMIAFIIPFYLQYRKLNNQKMGIQKQLQEFKSLNQLNIDQEETWRSKYYLGLDRSNKKLIYANWTAEIKIDLIDLTQIGKVSIQESARFVGLGSSKRRVCDLILLKLKLNQQDKEHTLELYDAEKFSDLQGEGPLAKKWEGIIQQEIKRKLVIV